MKVEIVKTFIESDINGEHKIVMQDENGVDWVNSWRWEHNAHALETIIIKKSECCFFNE